MRPILLLVLALSDLTAQLPGGAGRTALIRVCNSCHGADAVIGNNNTRKGWTELVDEMISKGAKASPAERREIVNYLAKNFPMRLDR